ncbi:MAG: putative 2-aminoethylphosphonate ABC transporter ATP-binding protein [Hyphomicrobiaceae bacterium]
MEHASESVSASSRSTPAPEQARVHVSIRDVTKRFGAFVALQSVNLDIFEGEFICFLGPSGCGKTTLLRAIAGLDPQSEGQIYIGGRDVSHLPPSDRDFGIVFQSYALFPNLTVSANVGYGLVNRRGDRASIARRVAELLETVGLSDQARKYPVQLSGGQQQRVALARALATEPTLLLLDEPLSALDARVRVRLRDELKSLQRRLGLTTIMVTHDQEEAMGLADRIVVMNKGLIEQVGTPASIYRAPNSPFVADFVGTMNFIPAEVAGPRTLKVGAMTLETAHDLNQVNGGRAFAAIRPEELSLTHTASGNTLSATVRHLGFHGGFCRVTVAPSHDDSAIIYVDIPAQKLREIELAEGQPLELTLPPEHLLVFPRD